MPRVAVDDNKRMNLRAAAGAKGHAHARRGVEAHGPDGLCWVLGINGTENRVKVT